MSQLKPPKLENLQSNEISSMNSFLSNSPQDKPKKHSRRQKSVQQSPQAEINEKNQKIKRTDIKGVKIVKGGKKHQICFKNKLVQVYVVDNWKEYNQFEEQEEEQEVGSCSVCKRICQII